MATWPTCGQRGYITPAVLGVPNAQRGGSKKTEIFAWTTCGQSGYITLAVLVVPNTQRGTKIRKGYVAHMWAKWLHHT